MPRVRLLCVTLLAGVVLTGCGGGSASPSAASGRHPAGVHHHHHHRTTSAFVTNAAPQASWRPYAGQGVPILVYHDLGTPPAGQAYPGLYVSDSDFESEMAWLHQQGYEAVTLDEMMSAFFHHGTLPTKPIVITFDNGYIPQATFAPSVLSRYGWPGVLNEITANHLSNARLESLLRIGWEVDSHSINHPDMTAISPTEVRYQLVASRNFLRHTFHIPANSFCYPSSRYNAAVIAATRAAGYTNAVTEHPGFATPQTDPYQLPRFEIEGGLSGLVADLRAG